VLILGILATIALPQLIQPSLQAKEAALSQNLNLFRKAIDLYHLQHTSTYPDKNVNTVVAQLTGKTDKDGDPGTDFGPYLRDIPRNPINNSAVIKLNSLPTVPNDSSGWYYDKDTGEIRANSSGTAASGIDFIDL
jgi:type II secretory pathway pseudopilin PulG